MKLPEILRGRKDESRFIIDQTKNISPLKRVFSGQETSVWEPSLEVKPVTRPPLHAEQWRIIFEALGGISPEVKQFLSEISDNPCFHGVTRGQILLEYTTAHLARELCELEINLHRQSKIQFAIPGFGHELIGVAIERHARQTDAFYPYYRQEANDLMRGGTVKDLLLMTAQKEGDPHSGGRVLAGHPASGWRSELPVISNVGAHVLTSVGIAQALKLRRRQDRQDEPWQRFEDPDAISICHVGDASMAQGEVSEALHEMCKDGGCPMLLVVHNNGSGISTDVREGSVGGDPIASVRGFADHGLKIIEVDGTNIQGMFDASREAVRHAREQKAPVVLHVFNVYKRVHSSSDDPSRYLSPSEIAKHESLDSLPLYRQYLITNDVATDEVFKKIEFLAERKVLSSGEKVLSAPDPDPEILYDQVYSDAFAYRQIQAQAFHPAGRGELDLLESSREQHVDYLASFRNDTQQVNMRQHITTVLAQEMKRDERIIVYGEDVADFSTGTLENLPDYLEQSLEEKSGKLTSREINAVLKNLLLIRGGRGHEIDSDTFSLLIDLLGGKGGVFKTTQFLQMLYGHERVWNSHLAEASIVGTAIGLAVSGFLPVIEIQFDTYLSPAYQQLVDQASTLRWRSNGQFSCGMVIRVQGMNRLKGVGGAGHGNVITRLFISLPGVRHVAPGDSSEAGPLFREAIRLAREHGEIVVFYEPIMELNSNIGYYQGEDTHIPLGEAQVREVGEDLLVLTYGNNIPLVEQAQREWKVNGKSATIVNLRSLGTQTDWKTIVPWVEKHGKVLIVESERSNGSAGANLSAQINEHFFSLLDAAVVRITARDIVTPAGILNEEFVLPQVKDIVRAGLDLASY